MNSDKTLILEGSTLKEAASDLVDAGWTATANNDAIEKSFKFADFPTAFAFMTQVAFAAEKADHHPEWFNVYNRVDVKLTTHDANGVTTRDLSLARVMEQACSQQNN
jgi:4a-hydroxytetrahydrobiopterin dehydratase